MKAQIEIRGLEKLVSKTKIEEEKVDKDGLVVQSRRMVTTVTFDCEASPRTIGLIASLMASGHTINCDLSSNQSVMDFMTGEMETAEVG